jgi:hypothetical protein
MGMLFKTPKYTRPPEMDASQKALEEREARAAREEAKQIRSIASRRRAMRGGGFINEENLDLLSGGASTEETIKNPYGRFR